MTLMSRVPAQMPGDRDERCPLLLGIPRLFSFEGATGVLARKPGLGLRKGSTAAPEKYRVSSADAPGRLRFVRESVSWPLSLEEVRCGGRKTTCS